MLILSPVTMACQSAAPSGVVTDCGDHIKRKPRVARIARLSGPRQRQEDTGKTSCGFASPITSYRCQPGVDRGESPRRSPPSSRQASYGAVKTIFRDASTLPYNSNVSYFTVTRNVSVLPASFRSFGTRHEYPQVPSQPKGIGPSATFLPAALLIVTIGSRESSRS